MKNTIKMSLVAAVAVAGFSTTASAGNLEDMIKDTTVSGKIEVGFNMDTTKTGNNAEQSSSEWEYDFDATLTTKVNDIISAQIGIQADHQNETRNDSTDSANGTGFGGATGDQSITLTKLNMIAKTDYATVIVGKQTQPTPFLDDERADGVVALVPAGPVTLAAGHFTGMVGGQSLGLSATGAAAAVAAGATSTSTSLAQRDISAVAAIAAVGPMNVQAWYLMASGADTSSTIEQGLDGYSIMVDGTFGPVKVNAAHSSLELDAKSGLNFDAETLTKVVASFDAGVATVFGGFGMTNDASHTVDAHTRLHGVDLSSDDDAKTNFALELTKLDAHNDATAFLLGATAKMDAITVTGQYLMATVESHTAGAADTDVWEINLEASYAMSKNFTVSGLYAVQDLDAHLTANDTDRDSIQLSMLYKF